MPRHDSMPRWNERATADERRRFARYLPYTLSSTL
jgi:hypothetical protein